MTHCVNSYRKFLVFPNNSCWYRVNWVHAVTENSPHNLVTVKFTFIFKLFAHCKKNLEGIEHYNVKQVCISDFSACWLNSPQVSLQLSVLGEENVKMNIIKLVSFYRELFPLYHKRTLSVYYIQLIKG